MTGQVGESLEVSVVNGGDLRVGDIVGEIFEHHGADLAASWA